MTVTTRQAIKIAKETAKEAGYAKAIVTDTDYDDDEETYEVQLQDDDVTITVSIDEDSGDVTEFTTE